MSDPLGEGEEGEEKKTTLLFSWGKLSSWMVSDRESIEDWDDVKSLSSLRQKGQVWIGNLRDLFKFDSDRDMTSNRSKWYHPPGKVVVVLNTCWRAFDGLMVYKSVQKVFDKTDTKKWQDATCQHEEPQ